MEEFSFLHRKFNTEGFATNRGPFSLSSSKHSLSITLNPLPSRLIREDAHALHVTPMMDLQQHTSVSSLSFHSDIPRH